MTDFDIIRDALGPPIFGRRNTKEALATLDRLEAENARMNDRTDIEVISTDINRIRGAIDRVEALVDRLSPARESQEAARLLKENDRLREEAEGRCEKHRSSAKLLPGRPPVEG